MGLRSYVLREEGDVSATIDHALSDLEDYADAAVALVRVNQGHTALDRRRHEGAINAATYAMRIWRLERVGQL